MQVFRAALRVFFKHPVYIGIYFVAMGFMAVFIGLSVGAPQESEFTAEIPNIAIIDRDNSTLSSGMADFLGEHSNIIEVEDSRRAMQDAIAQDFVSYIMIIPDGFGNDFMALAASGASAAPGASAANGASAASSASAPQIETVLSYVSIYGQLIDNLVDEYLNTARVYVLSETAQTQAEVVGFVNSDMAELAQANVLLLGESAPVSQQWLIFNQFSGYTLMLSIIVGVGVVLAAFNRTDVRRRNLISPISTLSMNLQVAAACVIVALVAWGWVSALGLVIFGNTLTGVGLITIVLILLALLVFSTVPLAVGFLIGQVTTSELAINATGNISGLVLSFLGGIWIPLELVNSEIVVLSHFTPVFYFGDALIKVVNLYEFTNESLMPIFVDMGIILLFSVTVFVVALVAGRHRMQSADAGGNAAAARARS